MIVWSSVDKKGQCRLNHFNLDIDKGGHSTVEAANAIHRSLQALHLDGVDVEFSFICGDSGGGAKVQLLYPRLKNELDVLCSLADYMNCILHAFNLSYKHACKDTLGLGDQGMNRNTVFQMCYLAILMIKTIKKHTNSQTLRSIYAKTMTQVLTNETYIKVSKESFIQAFEEQMDEVDEVQAADDKSLDPVEHLATDCPTNVMDSNFSR
jgi:hypothetical protein